MEKIKVLNRIAELYARGENVIQYLRSLGNNGKNTTEDILISYDFQAGSYIQYAEKNKAYLHNYTTALAKVMNDLGNFDSILEVGVGEATTLSNLIAKLAHIPENILGFDISWSRIKYAQQYAKTLNIPANLVVGDLFAPPICANSIDVVYTSHSIEPNGGREKEALQSLYNIAKKYLVLLEPAYELASPEAQARMKSHGYVRNLYETAQELGYKIINYRLFDFAANPLNPTGLLVIEKDLNDVPTKDYLACPITNSPLSFYPEKMAYFAPNSLLAYPVIAEVPCLLAQNAVIATHFLS